MRVVVIGAGLAGLTAACHLVGRGHDVAVLERARSVTREGFTHELGPVVMTMPELVESALTAAGSSLADLPVRRLDPAYRGAFSDGSEIRVRFGHDATHEEIREKSGEHDAANFDRFVAWLKQLYDVEMGNFIDKNFNSVLGLGRTSPGGIVTTTAGKRCRGRSSSSSWPSRMLRRAGAGGAAPVTPTTPGSPVITTDLRPEDWVTGLNHAVVGSTPSPTAAGSSPSGARGGPAGDE